MTIVLEVTFAWRGIYEANYIQSDIRRRVCLEILIMDYRNIDLLLDI